MNPKNPLVIYYNTRCPICNAGMTRQQRALIEAVKSGEITFCDINLEPDALKQFGIGLEDIRRRLHALQSDGTLLAGADVAIAIWQITPGERLLAQVAGNRFMLPISRVVYDRFADLLYAWNKRKGHW